MMFLPETPVLDQFEDQPQTLFSTECKSKTTMTHKMKFVPHLLGYFFSMAYQFHDLNHSIKNNYCENGEMTCKQHTLESTIKRIYPSLHFGILFFTFPYNLGLDILGYLRNIYIYSIFSSVIQKREPCLLFILSKQLP